MLRLIDGDCMEVLDGWRSGCVDAVVTDPPWNLGKDYGPHDDAMPRDAHVAWLGEILARCRRVSRGPVVFLPGSHLEDRVPELLARAGVAAAATLTWRKPAVEPIVWAGLPAPAPNAPRLLAVPEPPAGDPARGSHPCPKPPSLMRFLVGAAAPAGGLVLDPFAGSGTTLLAAAATGGGRHRDRRSLRRARPAPDAGGRRDVGRGAARAMKPVSVVMPVFDQASFIPRAIGSLLAQEVPGWELVVVDDGSADDVPAALPGDPRIALLRHDRNRGLGAALNTALDRTCGDVVAYLPADDVWHAGHLAELLRLLEDPGVALAHTARLPPGRELQLVQLAHRRTGERWLERPQLESDDLELLLLGRLRAQGRVASSAAATCTWTQHPGQRHRALRPSCDGGVNAFRRRYRVAEPLRLAADGAPLVDEPALYTRFADRPPPAPGGLRVLLAGELAHNPERVLALEERGCELIGLWIDDPLGFMTVGPLPFGHVRDVELDSWSAARPDVVYALLNWRSVPLAHRLLPSGVPLVFHFKEAPQRSIARGEWPLLADLVCAAGAAILSSDEERDVELHRGIVSNASASAITVSADNRVAQRWSMGHARCGQGPHSTRTRATRCRLWSCAQRTGSPERKRVTEGVPTAAARCAGPESFPTSSAASRSSAARSPSSVRPQRSAHGGRIDAATQRVTPASAAAPTIPSCRPRAARTSPDRGEPLRRPAAGRRRRSGMEQGVRGGQPGARREPARRAPVGGADRELQSLAVRLGAQPAHQRQVAADFVLVRGVRR